MNLDNDYDEDGNNIVPCPICLSNSCPSKEEGKCPEEDDFVRAMNTKDSEYVTRGRTDTYTFPPTLLELEKEAIEKAIREAYENGKRDTLTKDSESVKIGDDPTAYASNHQGTVTTSGTVPTKGSETPKSEWEKELSALIPCINIMCDGNGIAVGGSPEEPEPEQCEYCYRQRFPVFDLFKSLLQQQTERDIQMMEEMREDPLALDDETTLKQKKDKNIILDTLINYKKDQLIKEL